MDNSRKILSSNIKAARERAGLKQREVAEALDVSIRYYQKLESGERAPSPEYADRVARAIGCSPIELYGAAIGEEPSQAIDTPQIDPKIISDIVDSTVKAMIEKQVEAAKAAAVATKPALPHGIDLSLATPDQLEAIRGILTASDIKIKAILTLLKVDPDKVMAELMAERNAASAPALKKRGV